MNVEERFCQIYAETYKLAASLVTVRCRQTADVGDIVQEIYFEVYKILKKHGTEYIREPEAMIRTLVKQKLFQHYRTLSCLRETSLEPMEDGKDIELADIESMSVEEMAEDREVLEWTNRYLQEKGELYRKIFHLYYSFGMTIPEIATALDRTESDIKNKIFRTLKEMRAYWKGEKL